MSEKTAEAFQNKSDEEIIEWMIKHLSPEQIKSCLQGDIPDVEIPTVPIPTVPTPTKPIVSPRTVDELRELDAQSLNQLLQEAQYLEKARKERSEE